MGAVVSRLPVALFGMASTANGSLLPRYDCPVMFPFCVGRRQGWVWRWMSDVCHVVAHGTCCSSLAGLHHFYFAKLAQAAFCKVLSRKFFKDFGVRLLLFQNPKARA